MVILTLNCGSSSVKYQLYDWDSRRILATGIVERVTQPGSVITHKTSGKDELIIEKDCPDHRVAIELIQQAILDPVHGAVGSIDEIKAVGHRMVHGAEKFAKSVLVDDEALAVFREIQDLAPLHNPANIMGIEAARATLPKVPHCAIMDTAWHQTMPASSYMYALPYSWYQQYGVRRYGFHGTSFLYTAKRAAVLLGKDPFETNAIIAHVGNGSSINAVKDGCSYDTSMGLTPLEGLIMGTRSGDIDPAIPFYLSNICGLPIEEVEKALNKKSGILGITEEFVDRRDVQKAAEAGNDRAQLAIDMEAYRIRKYIGSYTAALGRVDALVFTAGVGERGSLIRELSTQGLEVMGIKLDPRKNKVSMTKNAETIISTDDSPTKIFVIPTDEELVMTEDTYALMSGTYDVHTNFTYSFQSAEYLNQERNGCVDQDVDKFDGLESILAFPPSPAGAVNPEDCE